MHEAKMEGEFFTGDDDFSTDMNQLLNDTNQSFHNLLEKHMAGELICAIAVK